MKALRDIYGDNSEAFFARRDKLLLGIPKGKRQGLRFFSSPGRAEIVGNHTDHNRGKVLVSAISCDILCAVREGGDTVEILSNGFRPIRIQLGDYQKRAEEVGKSSALVRGVLAHFAKEGEVKGFSARTTSNIFRGAGVSSSAAFSVLIAEIESALLSKGLSPIEKAQAAQFAENEYFGKPCGLLDQCGVAIGGMNKIDFLVPNAPQVTPLPMPKGYALILTHTGGSHAALTSHYAAIKREMEEVALFYGRQSLREVELAQLYEDLPILRKRVSERAVLRAIHFFEENERVERAARALQGGNEDAFLAQIKASGESSLKNLQNCFIPGSAYQPMTLALKLSERLLSRGAFRIMGGGFAGSVLAFVPHGEEGRYMDGMARVFGRENVFCAGMRPVGTTEIRI